MCIHVIASICLPGLSAGATNFIAFFQSRMLGCNLQADTVLGQSKAGLLNRVHALEEANVPANGTEVMKVDAS